MAIITPSYHSTFPVTLSVGRIHCGFHIFATYTYLLICCLYALFSLSLSYLMSFMWHLSLYLPQIIGHLYSLHITFSQHTLSYFIMTECVGCQFFLLLISSLLCGLPCASNRGSYTFLVYFISRYIYLFLNLLYACDFLFSLILGLLSALCLFTFL